MSSLASQARAAGPGAAQSPRQALAHPLANRRDYAFAKTPSRRPSCSAVTRDAGNAATAVEVRYGERLRSQDAYHAMHRMSLEEPDDFWAGIAEAFHWKRKWAGPVCEYNYDTSKGPIFIKWFQGAQTNVCYNALDRHVEAGKGDQVAFYFEGNEPGQSHTMTFQELRDSVCQIANYLKARGVRRGDKVAMYMPMVCELPAAMLACARIGAVHAVVFGGFSAEALASRLVDSGARVLLTCSGVMRGKKPVMLKAIADEAMEIAAKKGHTVEHCLTYEHPVVGREGVAMAAGRDEWWAEATGGMPRDCEVEWMEAEDPLFLLYTSGSTGKPKGVTHTTAGYMVGAATTFKYVFDYREGDIYWCTADCGWITGHSYLTYGPLINGAPQVIFEGVPTYPDASRCWEIVDRLGVTLFYTAPTAIRTLEGLGSKWLEGSSRKSLRVLGSVGEPINPEAWRWYHDVVGNGQCDIVDTYWQTETGSHVITPLPGAWQQKPGCATLPFFGVEPAVIDPQTGREIEGPGEGFLCFKRPHPSMMRTLAGDHERFEATYFSQCKGYYFTGDGCRRDEDGFYWITGRVDDVINVSGHRIGTAEVEAALNEHPLVAESAVVPMEHPVKGQGIYAYVTLMAGNEYPGPETVKKELVALVRKVIGPIATPDVVHWAPGLPKTRSGKIMRRVLRKIASKEEDQLGDTSTLADPSVVQQLIELRGK